MRFKIFSNYNFIESGRYHCPCCGSDIGEWSKVGGGKALSTPFGKLEEYMLQCPECNLEIDYLLSLKPH